MTQTEPTLDPGALGAEVVFCKAEDAETVSGNGNSLAFLLSGDDRNPDVLIGVAKPGSGPPLHSHPYASYEVVIEGRVRAVVDEVEYTLGPGDFLYTPPNAPHTYVVEGDKPARILGINLPGGSQPFFEDMNALMAESQGQPDLAVAGELAARHGTRLLGPPLSATS